MEARFASRDSFGQRSAGGMFHQSFRLQQQREFGRGWIQPLWRAALQDGKARLGADGYGDQGGWKAHDYCRI